MLGLKIVRKEQVEEWRSIEEDYNARLEENARLKMQLRDEQELISILKNKLHGTMAVIYPSNVPGCYIDMPHLRATFGKTNVVIDELHSDMGGGIYENKGYATMLLEVLIDIAKKSNCKSITGYLSNVDAKTAERKEKRNCFYSSKGFELSFVDDLHEEGHICLHI